MVNQFNGNFIITNSSSQEIKFIKKEDNTILFVLPRSFYSQDFILNQEEAEEFSEFLKPIEYNPNQTSLNL